MRNKGTTDHIYKFSKPIIDRIKSGKSDNYFDGFVFCLTAVICCFEKQAIFLNIARDFPCCFDGKVSFPTIFEKHNVEIVAIKTK
ncbi:MAG: hypothetical protein DWQ02_07930 [Bacteroidetes bacterium]|nr:MAG: hypothetical protein DWQ02_07930 [Bacteroidota bacterium]